jgi:sulfite oxidase
MGSDETGQIVHSREPYNAEPPLHRLRAAFLTPRRIFYVRSHGTIPSLDAATHVITVDGRVGKTLRLTAPALQAAFRHRTVIATIQCAGNRRADLQQVAPTSGDPWAPGAIGNAEWTGIRLADLLQAAETERDDTLHIAFAACDICETKGKRINYGASIPLGKAMSPEVLLAWAMNGEPLAPKHGYPLRAVVPGFAGVRSPKWLVGITVQDHPSDKPFQAEDYKLFPPNVTEETANPAGGMCINDMPLNSAICEPARYAVLPQGAAILRGYAIATARSVARVDVSANDGKSWHQAELETADVQPWSWTFWHASIDLPRGEHVLAVRAWDSAGQTQPARPDDVWNYKGYLCAAWHRVPVTVG